MESESSQFGPPPSPPGDGVLLIGPPFPNVAVEINVILQENLQGGDLGRVS